MRFKSPEKLIKSVTVYANGWREHATEQEVQRKREIAKWLFQGASDIANGLSRSKTPQNAARPYMRGFFGAASQKMPSRKEVAEIANMNMSELL